jgi:hypothetical protein
MNITIQFNDEFSKYISDKKLSSSITLSKFSTNVKCCFFIYLLFQTFMNTNTQPNR